LRRTLNQNLNSPTTPPRRGRLPYGFPVRERLTGSFLIYKKRVGNFIVDNCVHKCVNNSWIYSPNTKLGVGRRDINRVIMGFCISFPRKMMGKRYKLSIFAPELRNVDK
jgi:hypothetical protein